MVMGGGVIIVSDEQVVVRTILAFEFEYRNEEGDVGHGPESRGYITFKVD